MSNDHRPWQYNSKIERQVFISILLIDVFFNLMVLVYKFWFIDSLDVIVMNISFLLAAATSYLLYQMVDSKVAFNACLIMHLLIFVGASFFHITYYSTILIFVMGMIIPIYWTDNKSLHRFYFINSFCLGVIYIRNLLSYPLQPEGYRIFVEALIFLGLAFAFYQLTTIYFNYLRDNIKRSVVDDKVIAT